MKPEMIEGPEATANFELGMKKLFQVKKSELKEQEKKYKAMRKRKKAISSSSRAPGASA